MSKPVALQSLEAELFEANQKLEVVVAALKQIPTPEAIQALNQIGETLNPAVITDLISSLFETAVELNLKDGWVLVRLDELDLFPVLTIEHWRELQDLLGCADGWAEDKYKDWSGDRKGSAQ